jgi:hypothetical protein
VRRLLLSLGIVLAPASLPAQHPFAPSGDFDSTVPTPRQVLGHDIGERFTPHHLIGRYLDRLAVTSRRIRVDTLGATFEGREVFLAVVTSEANRRRLPEIEADARRLAEARGTPAELEAIARRLPAIVWLGFTVHGGEASGTEASLALLYQLAAGRDAETRAILDSVVVLIDPVQNPDGHERHVQDVMRRRGVLAVPESPAAMIHRGTWPGPRTSHYQFDLNRDWFLLSHPESRARVTSFLRWWPHVAVDLAGLDRRVGVRDVLERRGGARHRAVRPGAPATYRDHPAPDPRGDSRQRPRRARHRGPVRPRHDPDPRGRA